MLSLTRKTDYALVALARLAGASADDAADPVSARDIAEQFDLPLPLTMNVLKRLHRAGLVESMRGAKGGYYLAREAGAVRLTEVIEAIEGPVRVTACCGGASEAGSREGAAGGVDAIGCGVREACPITHAVRDLNERIYAFIHQYTLADLVGIKANGDPGWVPLEHVTAAGPRDA